MQTTSKEAESPAPAASRLSNLPYILAVAIFLEGVLPLLLPQ